MYPLYYLGPGLHFAIAHIILRQLFAQMGEPVESVFGAALLVASAIHKAVLEDMPFFGLQNPRPPQLVAGKLRAR